VWREHLTRLFATPLVPEDTEWPTPLHQPRRFSERNYSGLLTIESITSAANARTVGNSNLRPTPDFPNYEQISSENLLLCAVIDSLHLRPRLWAGGGTGPPQVEPVMPVDSANQQRMVYRQRRVAVIQGRQVVVHGGV